MNQDTPKPPVHSVKELMEKHFRRSFEDEDVIHLLVDLRRRVKNGNLGSYVALVEEIRKHHGKL